MFISTTHFTLLATLALGALSATASPLTRRDVPTSTQYGKTVSYTDFSTGVTACGQSYDSALNGQNSIGVDTGFGVDACGRQVTITAPNGQVHTGTVVDLGAENGNLNISPSMFSEFYNQEQGIFTADYVFDVVN